MGDSAGTLHILEIPWSLRQPTPNEVKHNTFLISTFQYNLVEDLIREIFKNHYACSTKNFYKITKSLKKSC